MASRAWYIDKTSPIGGGIGSQAVKLVVEANDALARGGRRYVETVKKKARGRVPFLPWNKNLLTSSGLSLDFAMFPFQREWYEDDAVVYAKAVSVMKATQCGASEYFVRWSLFFPDMHGDRALYVFPTARALTDFSDERIRPLTRSPYLHERISKDSIDNKMLKDVGPFGKWYARGSQNPTSLDSVPGDVLCLDEYDDIIQAHIPRAEKRLSSPLSRGLVRRFGVPRFTETGIHHQYELSDQRRWHVTCDNCEAEYPIHFYAQDEEPHHFVDRDKCVLICGNCEHPILPEWIRAGRWIAKYPERDAIGYHVSRLILPTADIADIVAESKRTKPYEVQEFWNSTLGLPYDPAEGRLSKQAIASATRDFFIGEWDSGYAGKNLVTAGVDVASTRDLNVRISEHLDDYHKRALWIGTVKDFDQLAVMMEAFRVHFMLIDHLPDGRLARAMVNRFPGRCFTVSWNDNVGKVMAVDPDEGTVVAQRTTTISATLDMIRQQKNDLPQNPPEEYVRHLRAAILARTEDDKGRVKVYYTTGEDHDYLQAECYDTLATEAWWELYGQNALQRQTFERLEDHVYIERSRLGDIGYTGTTAERTATREREMYKRQLAADEMDEGPAEGMEFGGLRDW